MLEVIEKSQENTASMRRYEAHGRFWLWRKGNTDETQHPSNAPITTAVGHRH